MTRILLLCTVILACVIGAGLAFAQSMRDIVNESEDGRMPTQQLGSGDAAFAPNAVPPLATSCVPPGMPAVSDLISVGHELLVAPIEGTDETVPVTAVRLVRKDHFDRYRLGERPLDFITYFVRGHLAAVDDHPGDPTEPDLVDTGMVSPRGAALARGTPMCQWERLPRKRPGGDGAETPASRI